MNVRHAKQCMFDSQKQVRHINTDRKSKLLNIGKFIAGAIGIVLGARLLVDNGIQIAGALGVSEGIIGVTVVAVGTSLPELVTTITALKKKEASLGIGNILGANILNFTMILSTCGFISENGLSVGNEAISVGGSEISRTLFVDIPVTAVLFTALLLVPLFAKGKLKRLQGFFMLAVYIAFITFLIVKA